MFKSVTRNAKMYMLGSATRLYQGARKTGFSHRVAPHPTQQRTLLELATVAAILTLFAVVAHANYLGFIAK